MTPKEKAEELVDKYICNPVVYHCKNGCITIDCMDMDAIKRCVLITVEEIISVCYAVKSFETINYYKQVKNEIELL